VRAVTFKSVLDRALRLLKVPPADAMDDEVAELTEAINVRLRTAWEAFPWPERTRIEQRYFRADYAAGTAYALDDEIYYPTTDAYYRALGPTTGNAPTNATYWEEATTDLERYVAWEQTGETAVGEFFTLWSGNPRISRTAYELGFSLSDRGAELSVSATAGTSVWVEYGIRPPVMTATEYDATQAYAVNDTVYFVTDGRCYTCTATAAAGDTPLTDPTKWAEIEFPYILGNYCAQGAYQDQLKGEGQSGRSRMESQDVEMLLAAEIEKIENVQGQKRRFGCATRARV
jgi:hypothetical protein